MAKITWSCTIYISYRIGLISLLIPKLMGVDKVISRQSEILRTFSAFSTTIFCILMVFNQFEPKPIRTFIAYISAFIAYIKVFVILLWSETEGLDLFTTANLT